jgi:hypothetical protein
MPQPESIGIGVECAYTRGARAGARLFRRPSGLQIPV